MSDPKLEELKTAAGAMMQLIDSRLASFKDRTLDSSTCIEIYTTIFSTIAEIFENSQVQVENETVNWIAQTFYDVIEIGTPGGGMAKLDPNIFDKKAMLENIKTPDVALLYVMFKDQPWLIADVVKEIRRRN